MKAVARLILTYFTALDTLIVASAGGAVAVLFAALLGLVGSAPFRSLFSLQALGFAVLWAVFFASMFMPSTFSRLAHSQSIDLLPNGRFKLLIATFATILIASLHIPIGFVAVMKTAALDELQHGGLQDAAHYGSGAYYQVFLQAPFFWRVYAISVLTYTWIYIVLWSAAAIRANSNGAMARTLLLMAAPALLLPKYGRATSALSLADVIALILVVWSLYWVGFLLLLRSRSVVEIRVRVTQLFKGIRWADRKVSGNETRLILGLLHPWFYIALISFCALSLLASAKSSNVWIFYLTIFALVFGGLPANATAKARGLWLRLPQSREQLYVQIESILWKDLGVRMAIMGICGVLLGMYARVSLPLIICGILHAAIAAVASMYLGLMQMQNRRWSGAVAVVFTYAIAIAGAAASNGDLIDVPVMTLLLALIAWLNRVIGKQRWARLDWMLCKPLR